MWDGLGTPPLSWQKNKNEELHACVCLELGGGVMMPSEYKHNYCLTVRKKKIVANVIFVGEKCAQQLLL